MSPWYAVHLGLSAYVRGPQAASLYATLTTRSPALATFRDPRAVVTELATKQGSARNELVLELVTAWRRDRDTRALVGALLIHGLWNDLSVVRQLLVDAWEDSVDEAEGLLFYRLLHALGASDVAETPDAAMSLVRAAARDTKRALRRARELTDRDLLIGGLMITTAPGVTATFDTLSERDLRQALASILSTEDLDLLVEVFLNDRPRQWLIERFRRTSHQITLRLYRVLSRLRRLA